MELTEAAQRILRHHLGLILVLVALGVALPVLVSSGHEDTYVATTRVVIGTTGDTSPEEANALVDTADGVLTSQEQVRRALTGVDTPRDADEVAGQVAVTPIGSSGVFDLSVTDADPDVASEVANTLALQYVDDRGAAEVGDKEKQLAGVQADLADVNTNITEIEAEIRAASPDGVAQLDPIHNNLLDQRATLIDQRQSLTDALAATPQSSIVNPAEIPTTPEPSGLKPRLALGALLGLILGVAAAAVLEALRPTIVNGDALARALGAPVMGRLPGAPGQVVDLEDPILAQHVRLTARGAGVDAVRLTSVGGPVELEDLAKSLEAEMGSYPNISLAENASGSASAPFVVDQKGGPGLSLVHPVSTTTGLVVVAPEVLKQSELTPLEHLLVMTQWPLIGIIAYKPAGWRDRVGPLVRRLSARAGSARSAPEST